MLVRPDVVCVVYTRTFFLGAAATPHHILQTGSGVDNCWGTDHPQISPRDKKKQNITRNTSTGSPYLGYDVAADQQGHVPGRHYLRKAVQEKLSFRSEPGRHIEGRAERHVRPRGRASAFQNVQANKQSIIINSNFTATRYPNKPACRTTNQPSPECPDALLQPAADEQRPPPHAASGGPG